MKMKAAHKRSLKSGEHHRKTSPGTEIPQNALSSDEALSLAEKYLEEGNLKEAETICRRVLAFRINNADALCLLGLIGLNTKVHASDAADLFRMSLALKPDNYAAWLNLGNALRLMRNFAEALECFHKAADISPDQAEPYYKIGVVHQLSGKIEDAVFNYRKAIDLKPDHAEAYANLGVALKASGFVREAETVYREALKHKPDYAEAYSNLAVVLNAQGRYREAERYAARAVELSPELAPAYCNLGNALKSQGKLEEAIAAYMKAVETDPDYPDAYGYLGLVMYLSGRVDDAISFYREALQRAPKLKDIHLNLGVALKAKGELAQAAEAYGNALEIDPKFCDAIYNLGNVYMSMRRYGDAIVEFQKAIEIRPDHAEAFLNMGIAMQSLRIEDQAIYCYDRALEIKPDHPEAHIRRAIVNLLLGNYAEGWDEYEWRWKGRELAKHRPNYNRPLWDGDPASIYGKTILIIGEQGIGDNIQFVRYAPLVARLGARVIIRCRPEIVNLFKRIPGVSMVLGLDAPLPEFDFYCPMLSLPRLFKTTPENIPDKVPYLSLDENLLDLWKSRLSEFSGIKVALAWAGSPTHPNDANRSFSLSVYEPLFSIPGISYFSIQKGPAERQLTQVPFGARITDLSPHLFDFTDTAAILHNLDLLITADASVAHLCGALGKPAWILTPFAPDWRWGTDVINPPWYPTISLFRQAKPGDWSAAIASVTGNLRRIAAESTA